MPQALENLVLLVGPFSLLIQIALCVHVYKTGRPYWWIWILFMGSLLGCLAYLLIEIVPELRMRRPRLGGAGWWVPRGIRLRRAREVVDESPTVENRLALAALLSDFGRTAEAEAIAAECPTGVFKNDPQVIAEVVCFKLAVGKLTEAEQLLVQADAKHNRTAKARLDLLRARVLLGKGEATAARALLESLVPAALGEEPRYHLGRCLLKMGSRDEAHALFTDILHKYRKSGAIWRRAEKPWFKDAKQALAECDAAPQPARH
jgi:hypothetical protein